MNNMKKELAVAALENGTVIDHIPPHSLFKVVDLLGIANLPNSVTIGNNLSSRRYGKKGIIKIADVFFPEETLSRIALVAPNANINVIRNYEIVDIVKCGNPKCISNNEPMPTRFHVVDRENRVIRCHYCEREVSGDDIIIK